MLTSMPCFTQSDKKGLQKGGRGYWHPLPSPLPNPGPLLATLLLDANYGD